MSRSAVASLALGVFLDFSSTRNEGGLSVYWAEGIVIVLAILITVIVGSLNNWKKERRLEALNETKYDRFVKVIRDGGERLIPRSKIVVGDLVLLEQGDVVPCDGVFISGHNVRCDEFNATGEPDSIKKVPYEECIALRDKRLPELDPGGPFGDGQLLGHVDCFLVSESQILEGVCTYVVIAVGTKSFNGRVMTGLFIILLLI